MSVFTYLLQSQMDGSFYVGISQDPTNRLYAHNHGGLKVTAGKKPYFLVYLKAHADYVDARKHEKWLKKKNRSYKQMLAQLAPPVRAG